MVQDTRVARAHLGILKPVQPLTPVSWTSSSRNTASLAQTPLSGALTVLNPSHSRNVINNSASQTEHPEVSRAGCGTPGGYSINSQEKIIFSLYVQQYL